MHAVNSLSLANSHTAIQLSSSDSAPSTAQTTPPASPIHRDTIETRVQAARVVRTERRERTSDAMADAFGSASLTEMTSAMKR
jgi:hypothetical protein